jgi:hypothetical protein
VGARIGAAFCLAIMEPLFASILLSYARAAPIYLFKMARPETGRCPKTSISL